MASADGQSTTGSEGIDQLPDNSQTAFRAVCDMEKPLGESRRLLGALNIIACNSEDEQQSGAIYSIVRTIEHHLAEAEEKRGGLFRLFHPNRAEFERDGWPADEATRGGV